MADNPNCKARRGGECDCSKPSDSKPVATGQINIEAMMEIENSLQQAGKSLRCAWRMMKKNGLEATAKEVADTVIDVEEAAVRMSRFIREN